MPPAAAAVALCAESEGARARPYRPPTIVGQANGTDRTSTKHRARLDRIEIDRQRTIRRKRQKRAGDALPRQAQRVVEEGRDLLKEAKGLGRPGPKFSALGPLDPERR